MFFPLPRIKELSARNTDNPLKALKMNEKLVEGVDYFNREYVKELHDKMAMILEEAEGDIECLGIGLFVLIKGESHVGIAQMSTIDNSIFLALLQEWLLQRDNLNERNSQN